MGQININNDEAFIKLSNAIIVNAVTEYIDALKKIDTIPKGDERALWRTKRKITECELFFEGDWYRQLCGIEEDGTMLDGCKIMEWCRVQAEKKKERRIRKESL